MLSDREYSRRIRLAGVLVVVVLVLLLVLVWWLCVFGICVRLVRRYRR